MLKNDGAPVAEPKHPFALYPAFEPSCGWKGSVIGPR